MKITSEPVNYEAVILVLAGCEVHVNCVASKDVKHTPMGNLNLLVWMAAMEPVTRVTVPNHDLHIPVHVAPKDSATKLLLHHVFPKVSSICQIQDVLSLRFRDHNLNIVF